MKKSFPNIRMRRLRANNPIRNLVRENNLFKYDLIQPIFIIDGKNKIEKITSMPNIYRMSIDIAIKEIKALHKIGLQGVALFPCISERNKDNNGSESYNADGLMQKAISHIKKAVKDIAIINFGPIIEKGGLQKEFITQNINIKLDGLESRLNEQHIKYDSVSRFQGLEYPIVILTNFNNELNESEKNNLYIALTRSMNELIIITEKEKIDMIYELIERVK